MTKAKPYFIWAVEILWVTSRSTEWLFQEALLTKKLALRAAKGLRKSGYKFRVAKYQRVTS